MYTSAGGADLKSSRISGWVGWIAFAAMMMLLSGMFSFIWGIVALVRDEAIFQGRRGNVINLDYTAWGWIAIIVGLIVAIAGVALLGGALWASLIAVFIAMLSIINNLLVLGAYPVWSVIIIVLNVLVIYAITVHGQELSGN